MNAGVTQLVECNLAKVDVTGSSPVTRSILFSPYKFIFLVKLWLFPFYILIVQFIIWLGINFLGNVY